MNDVVVAALTVIGGAFMLLAGVGILRMPDVFMRMQAATKAATLGAGCMLLAVSVHFGDLAVVARAALVIAFILLTAPVAAHVIARAAYSVGTPLWGGTIADELREERRLSSAQTEEGHAASPAHSTLAGRERTQ
jgi:multicomponent Na+:H+ antiporter subunit G